MSLLILSTVRFVKILLRSILGWALLVYTVVASALALYQWNYFNADFIGYATVARRFLIHPAGSVTGYWSPLFSWLMLPFLYAGISDMLAGRLVLLAAGGIYITALYYLARSLAPADEAMRRLFLAGMLFCAVLEAVLWTTYLLDPDLLASALLFTYLAIIINNKFMHCRWRALAAGLCAGFAYLAKAYMLPFILVQLPMVMLFIARRNERSVHTAGLTSSLVFFSRQLLRSFVLILLGLMLVAVPWILILSVKYTKLTLSTAGSANHANVGPLCFGRDLLWNPPLQFDFIFDPHFGPDWSLVESLRNFQHQLYLIVIYTWSAVCYLISWLVMLGVAWWWLWRLRRRSLVVKLDIGARQVIGFMLITVGLYLAGYVMVNIESRYIIPVIAPLCCLVGLTCFCSALNAGGRLAVYIRQSKSFVVSGLLLVLPFLVADGLRIRKVFKHQQSTLLSPNQSTANELRNVGLLAQPFASSRWHSGLDIAYAGHAVSMYLGQPLSGDIESRSEELLSANAHTYVCFRNGNAVDLQSPLPNSWKRVLSLSDPNQIPVDVYVFTK